MDDISINTISIYNLKNNCDDFSKINQYISRFIRHIWAHSVNSDCL